MKVFARRTAAAVLWTAIFAACSAAQAMELPAVSSRIGAGTRMVEARKGEEGLAAGTCFFVCPDGLLVTTAHILRGAERILIKKRKDDEGMPARQLAALEGWDLAVLEAAEPQPPGDGECLNLAETSVHAPGTDVAYSGYAFGTDASFMSVYSTYRGIISSVLAQESDDTTGHFYNLGSLVISGLSGGPLYLPDSGRVIGVITRHYGPRGAGMGFGGAVASDVLSALLEKARKGRPAAPPDSSGR